MRVGLFSLEIEKNLVVYFIDQPAFYDRAGIYLENDLFFAGVRPAINIGISVSRVGSKAQTKAMKQAAATLKLDMASYWDLQAFAQFASDLDKATQAQLGRGVRTVEVLKQNKNAPMALADQIAIIYAATNGYLDDLPVERVKAAEEALLPFLHDRYADVIYAVNSTRTLAPETEQKLKQGIEEFKTRFTKA